MKFIILACPVLFLLWCKGFHYSKYFHLTYLLNLFFVLFCCFFIFLNYYRVICTCSAANLQQRTRRHYGLLIFVSALCFLLRLFVTCVLFHFWYRLLFFFLGSRVWRKQAAKSWVRSDWFSFEYQKSLLMGDLSPARAVISWQFCYHYSNFILRAPAF